jgi:hypothetical protein
VWTAPRWQGFSEASAQRWPERLCVRPDLWQYLGAFRLTNHMIDQQQYTILVTAVIGSAVVPTLIAQRWFMPALTPANGQASTSKRVDVGTKQIEEGSHV